MPSVPLQTAQERLADLVERVRRHQERIVVTRDDRPVAVLISPDELESLEETLAILSDPDAMREIAEGERAIAEGDVVRGVEAVRALRSIRQSEIADAARR